MLAKCDNKTNTLYEEYQNKGYLVIPDFIPSIICDLLMSHMTSLIERLDLDRIKSFFSKNDNGYTHGNYFLNSAHGIDFFIDKNAFDEQGNIAYDKKFVINKIGHGLHEADPVFYCFSQMHCIIHLLEQLNVTEPTLLQSMYLCKQPFFGDEVDCHQDETYIWTEDGSITGLWFALEDATIENGCLWVLPGGHHKKLKQRMFRTPDDQIHMETYDNTPWSTENMIPLEAKKGTIVVLHGRIPHLSYRNQSQFSRHAYTLHVKAKHQKLAVGNWLSADGQGQFVQVKN